MGGLLENVAAQRPHGVQLMAESNAYAERFVESIKRECLNRMILVGQESLDRSIAEYVAHYHEERSHQGLENELINGAMPRSEGSVERKERLGGLLTYYHRAAA